MLSCNFENLTRVFERYKRLQRNLLFKARSYGSCAYRLIIWRWAVISNHISWNPFCLKRESSAPEKPFGQMKMQISTGLVQPHMNCGLVFLLIRGNRSHNPTKPPKFQTKVVWKTLFGKTKPLRWVTVFHLTQSTIFQTTYHPQTLPINQYPNHD